MPDLLTNVLKVNQSINNGFDNNTVKNNPIVPGDNQIRNIVDPDKVVRPDGKNETEDKRFPFNTESNYGNFIQNLREMPQLQELFSKLFVLDYQTVVSSGLGEAFAEQLTSFMEMMEMDESQLLTFMKGQADSAGKFGGPFFQALKEVLNGTASIELRTGILEFLKRYSDMASSEHLLRNILASMGEMEQHMFKADADILKELAARLIFTEERMASPSGLLEAAGEGKEALPADKQAAAATEGKEVMSAGGESVDSGEKTSISDRMNQNILENGRLLKEEILPFFSKYINRTHDLGKVRDIMTLITLNISRYVNGDKENLMQSLEKLFQFGDFKQRLGDLKEGSMEAILNHMLLDQKRGEDNPWTEKFVSLLRSGLSGEGGHESKTVFQNILTSMLLNESVYMPLLHVMIPVNLNGSYMFSEIWVDPDASGGHTEIDDDEKPGIRMLIKFDIKDVGFFDVVLNYRNGDVDMFIAYPPKLSSQEKNIRNGIGQLVADHGLSFQSLTLEQGNKPISLMDVFPRITEGRNSVDVRV